LREIFRHNQYHFIALNCCHHCQRNPRIATGGLANTMEKEGRGKQLDQFSNRDNSGAHINTTAQEIWQDTNGEVTHFVSAHPWLHQL
jgi:cysteine synthase